MNVVPTWLSRPQPLVIGSIGSLDDLLSTSAPLAQASCDWIEIRLDLLPQPLSAPLPNPQLLASRPILLTARCPAEGGQQDLSPSLRHQLLLDHLDYAACVDLELASIPEMQHTVEALNSRGTPWLASYHHFHHTPTLDSLVTAAASAKLAGACMFKVAAMIQHPEDLATLAHFQKMDHGLPISTMGMGALAPVSRLLCAQFGSRFNYGYLGTTPTAPGQWSAQELRSTIARLSQIP